MNRLFRLRLLPGAVIAAFATAAAAADGPARGAAVQELPAVEVVSTTPLPGLGTERRMVPANVQTATDKDLRQSQSLNLPDFMSGALPSVNVNDVQGNPFQPDVNFRGFTASPLLGTPQGLSVFVDGVRVNEVFGDTVNWDLIPQFAVSNVTLVPGSNPLFGLNTLGGALSLSSKSGATHAGTTAEAYGGSFGRKAVEATHGGTNGNVNYFVGGQHFREDGWRDASPSDVDQFFGKLGWADERTELDLSYSFADNKLIGNAFAPRSMLDQRFENVYTLPDETKNRLNFIIGRANHWLNDDTLLAVNVYSRNLHTNTFNGDLNDDYAEEFEALTAAGGACALDPACAAAALAGQTAANNRTATRQRAAGLDAQVTLIGKLGDRVNRLTLGGAYDHGRTDFTQSRQTATLRADRSTDGGSNPDLVDTELDGRSTTWSAYFTDLISLTPAWHLTLSGRYNHTEVKIDDHLIDPPNPESLTAKHTFSRFNPALGLNFAPDKTLTAYASYNEGSRAPTPVELGCANPDNVCKLPNAFAGDPPLDQVVARTVEIGARGQLGGSITYTAAVYQTRNDDDILFVASNATGAGYFKNYGKTQRRGVELGLTGSTDRLTWQLAYGYVRATFESPEVLLSPNNSTATDLGSGEANEIRVSPGDRIPGIPEHQFKALADLRFTDQFSAGLALQAYSSQFVRGNENNAHQADGVNFFGAGEAPGYALVNLHARYLLGQNLELFARVNNVFDRKYYTGGLLGVNAFDAGGAFIADPDDWRRETFFGPGAPRAGWIGIRYAFDAPTGTGSR